MCIKNIFEILLYISTFIIIFGCIYFSKMIICIGIGSLFLCACIYDFIDIHIEKHIKLETNKE